MLQRETGVHKINKACAIAKIIQEFQNVLVHCDLKHPYLTPQKCFAHFVRSVQLFHCSFQTCYTIQMMNQTHLSTSLNQPLLCTAFCAGGNETGATFNICLFLLTGFSTSSLLSVFSDRYSVLAIHHKSPFYEPQRSSLRFPDCAR